jgi:predicted DNA-binding transcriptional regulator AlpA
MEANQNNSGTVSGSPVIVVCLVSLPAQEQTLWAELQEALSAAVGSIPSAPRTLEAPTVDQETADKWLNHAKAAKYLQCSESTLYKYASQNKIENRKLMGRLAYRQSVLDEFKNTRVRTPRPSRAGRSRGKITPALGSGK